MEEFMTLIEWPICTHTLDHLCSDRRVINFFFITYIAPGRA